MSLRSLEWVKQTKYAEHFPAEYNDMIELIGIDLFLAVLERFGKTPIYFSEKPLTALRREFILKNPKLEAKELARMLKVSDRYVQTVRGGRDPETLEMFEEN